MALAPQRGAGLMSLMVGMSIGLGVLLLANEQLRQLGARYRANQARDQKPSHFVWRGVFSPTMPAQAAGTASCSMTGAQLSTRPCVLGHPAAGWRAIN